MNLWWIYEIYIYIIIYLQYIYSICSSPSMICDLWPGIPGIATRIELSNLSNESILASLTANNDQTPTVIHIYMCVCTIYIYYIYNIYTTLYILMWYFEFDLIRHNKHPFFKHGSLSHDHFPQETRGLTRCHTDRNKGSDNLPTKKHLSLWLNYYIPTTKTDVFLKNIYHHRTARLGHGPLCHLTHV
jgi:hypothetical protein